MCGDDGDLSKLQKKKKKGKNLFSLVLKVIQRFAEHACSISVEPQVIHTTALVRTQKISVQLPICTLLHNTAHQGTLELYKRLCLSVADMWENILPF